MTADTPQLKLRGAVADAVALWSLAFPDMSAESTGADGPPGAQRVEIAGQPLILTGGTPDDEPADARPFCLLIRCDSATRIDRIARILATGGDILMPLGEYPFAPRYTWLTDRFGVSWQIALTSGESA